MRTGAQREVLSKVSGSLAPSSFSLAATTGFSASDLVDLLKVQVGKGFSWCDVLDNLKARIGSSVTLFQAFGFCCGIIGGTVQIVLAKVQKEKEEVNVLVEVSRVGCFAVHRLGEDLRIASRQVCLVTASGKSLCKLRNLKQIEDSTDGKPEKLSDYVVKLFGNNILTGSAVTVNLLRASGAVVPVDADLQGLSIRELFTGCDKIEVQVKLTA